MNKMKIRNAFMLFLTAAIWGCAFVAQSVGMDYVGPFTFSAIRSLIGSLFLVPCIFLARAGKERGKNKQKADEDCHVGKEDRKILLAGGASCGIIICIASNLQQFGIQYTSVGKSGFLTALYIVFVPLIGLFFRRPAGKKLWIAVILALLGLYLLCMKAGQLSFHLGDILLLLGAVAFSVHILVIDYFTQRADGVKMSCIQFFVCGILSAIAMFFFENPDIGNIIEAWMPILYAGVFSSGVAYTLQIVGQRGMNPVTASLILSLESVISAAAGWVLLGQALSNREIFGSIIIFSAIILAQLPDKKRERAENHEKASSLYQES